MLIPWQHLIYAGPSKPSHNLIKTLHEYTVNNKLEMAAIRIATFTHYLDVTHGILTAKES